MIKMRIKNIKTYGVEDAIRGMRNSWNSWDKSDSEFGYHLDDHNKAYFEYKIGPKDKELMMKLIKAGPSHSKFRRMIVCYMDITAPLYWWKEFDTYKVGTVANSCSTMHTICDREFKIDDFSHEYLVDTYLEIDSPIYIRGHSIGASRNWSPKGVLENTIKMLNRLRKLYLETKNKDYWYQIIQLLPESYNQIRTVMLNYEVLANIYEQRKNHKLDEWRVFCNYIEYLQYSFLITGENQNEETRRED